MVTLTDQTAKLASLLSGIQNEDPRLFEALKIIVDNLQLVFDKTMSVGSPLTVFEIVHGDSAESGSLVIVLRHRGALAAKAKFTASGDIIFGPKGALDLTATAGFPYIPTCAGTPTGIPQNYSGVAPIVYDTTGKKLWVYDFATAAWKGVVVV